MDTNTDKKLNYVDWVEKFRSKTTSQVLLPSPIKKFFMNIVETKELPNLIIHSSIPGSGKTTLAKALCKDLELRYIYINGSLETSIEVLRGTIRDFAMVRSISGNYKVVILDEFEKASPAFQDALKVTIEEYHKSCKFIFLCNNISKIITPLRQGRVMEFDFNMAKPEYRTEMIPRTVNYLKKMLDFEKVSYTEGSIEALVEKYYPSIRTCISILQQYSMLNNCIDSRVVSFQEVSEEFYESILNKKFEKARKYIVENGIPFNDAYGLLFRNLIPKIPSTKRSQAILVIDEQLFKSLNSTDPEIPFASCLIKIMGIL